MKTTYLSLISLSLISASPANAQPKELSSRSLSLSEVTAIVVANNPAIKESMAKWEATKQRITQEAAWDDLKVSAMARTARFVSVPPNAFTDESVSIEQAIPISGKNRARARIAAQDAVVAYEAARREQLDVITRARIAYFRLADGYAQRELNNQNLASLRQIAEIGRSRYEVGAESAAEVLIAETEASKLMETRRDFDNTIALNQSQLNVLMNRDAFVPIVIAAPPSLHSTSLRPEWLRTRTLAKRPEILSTHARLAGLKSGVDLARRGWMPDPSVSVQGQRYNGAAQGISELDAGITFSIPWGNYRKYSASVSEARSQLEAATHANERAETEAIGLLRDALQKVETAHHHVDLFREKLVPQSRQAFEASQFTYEAGKSGFSEWIAAQRTLRDLQAMEREHLTDYQIAMAELESVVGDDLGIFGAQTKEFK